MMVINALIITFAWVVPMIFLGTLLDQLMPEVKQDETKLYTLTMLIVQMVLSFLLFGSLENLIKFINKNYVKSLKMPALISGAIMISTIQSETQINLYKRISRLDQSFDDYLTKKGIR